MCGGEKCLAGEGGCAGMEERGAGLRVVNGDHLPRSSFNRPGLRGCGDAWWSSGPSANGWLLGGGDGDRGIFGSFPSGWGDCKQEH